MWRHFLDLGILRWMDIDRDRDKSAQISDYMLVSSPFVRLDNLNFIGREKFM